MKKTTTLLLAVLALTAIVSCKKETVRPELRLSSTVISFASPGGTEKVAVLCDEAWKAESDADWLSAEVSADESRLLLVTASANVAAAGSCAAERKGTVTVSTAGTTKTISVTQSAEDVIFSVTGDTAPGDFTWKGGSFAVKVTSNVSYKLTKPDWVTTSSTKASKIDEIEFVVPENEGEDNREGQIVIAPSAAGADTVSIAVKQSGMGARDIKVTFKDGSAPFKAGDKVLITDGTRQDEYELRADDITAEGAKIVTKLQDEFYVVYPSSAFGSLASDAITFTVPSDQSGSLAVYVGKTGTDALELVPATATITFSTAGIDVQTIELEASGICGTATATFSGQDVSISAGNAGKVSLQLSASGPFAMAILPATLAKGTTFTFKSASATVGSASLAEAKNLAAGQSLAMGAAVIDKAVPGAFSVSETKKVAFANGNLNYKASTKTWSFAEHQYISLKTSTEGGNATLDGRESQDKLIDLFGWGATGENENGAKPTDWNSTNGNYKTAATASADELLSISNKADWGYCFGGSSSPWFTLTRKEFAYVFQTRTASTVSGVENARCAASCIADTYNGIILFPDTFTLPEGVTINPDTINNFAIADDGGSPKKYTANPLTEEQWASLEAAGCVFLPATCNRTVSSSKPKVSNLTYGFYWCAEAYDATKAQSIAWDCKALTGGSGRNRSQGIGVRLVTEVK